MTVFLHCGISTFTPVKDLSTSSTAGLKGYNKRVIGDILATNISLPVVPTLRVLLKFNWR